MAPNVKGTPKSTPQVHRVNNKSNATKCTSSSPSKRSVITTVKKTADRIVVKDSNLLTSMQRTKTFTTTIETKGTQLRQRTKTEQNPTTPKAKGNRQTNPPTSVTKSASKPSWKRRPRPAHSGVPVPEKMRKLLNKFFEEENRLQTS